MVNSTNNNITGSVDLSVEEMEEMISQKDMLIRHMIQKLDEHFSDS